MIKVELKVISVFGEVALKRTCTFDSGNQESETIKGNIHELKGYVSGWLEKNNPENLAYGEFEVQLIDQQDVFGFAPKKKGRPSKGVTKKVSITMSQENWDYVASVIESDVIFGSKSEYLAYLVDRDMERSAYNDDTNI